MGFAIQHFVALLNCGLSDGLGQMALVCAARTQKERIFALADESRAGFQLATIGRFWVSPEAWRC